MKKNYLTLLLSSFLLIPICLGGCSSKNSKVTVTTLIENSASDNKNLENQHGISMLIETNKNNILFDTSKNELFLKNSEEMSKDLSKVDSLVLSHAHYDHCGGVKPLLEKFNIKPDLYVGEKFFKDLEKYHYSKGGGPKLDFTDGKEGYTYIGIDFDENYIKSKNINVKPVSTENKLNDKVTVYGGFKETSLEPLNPSMQIKTGEDKYKLDNFEEEVAISIDTDKGLVILTGCSHNGIVNIVESIKSKTNKEVYAVIGGTHLVEADEARIQKTIDYFKKLGVKKIGLSHCTGDKAVKMFKEQLPEETFVNSTGITMDF